MRRFVTLVISLVLAACADRYADNDYACRSHGGARAYSSFASRPPPSGAVVGFVSL
jgi:hypothetical protein